MSVAFACSLFGGEDVTLAGTDTEVQAPSLADDNGRPVVEVLPPQADDRPPLDPDADPQTPLGRLRARYLPVWTQEFDGAFPPETCGTAWELDGIAEPAGGIDISLYGDVPIMAALAVMRYEHLVSRALAEPSPLAQLCVAVGSVGPARTASLESLQKALETGQPTSAGSSFPSEVTLVAVGPSAALAVACADASASRPAMGPAQPHGGDASPSAGNGEAPSPTEPTELRAYLLRVSRGQEDRVADTSYRVFQSERRRDDGCSSWSAWVAQWSRSVELWLGEGQVWQLYETTVSAQDICDAPRSTGSNDCPLRWDAP